MRRLNLRSQLPGLTWLMYRHWFYEDFIREYNPQYPSLPLKKFSEMLFRACPLIEHWSVDHEKAFEHFMQYKTRVPVCGAIMLNAAYDKVGSNAFTSTRKLMQRCSVCPGQRMEVFIRMGFSQR